MSTPPFRVVLCCSAMLRLVLGCASSEKVDADDDDRTDGATGVPSSSGTDAGAPQNDASAVADGAPVEVSAICTDLALRSCDLLAGCRGQLFGVLWTSADECEARTTKNCVDLYPPGSVVRSDDARALVSCMEAWSCDALYDGGLSAVNRRYDPYFGCAPPRVQDAVPNGDPCFTSRDCESGACYNRFTSSCGRCVAPLAPGSSCDPDRDVCLGGRCTSSGVCTSSVTLDETCDENRVCTGPLLCRSGRCALPGGAGAACSSDEPCDPTAGLACDPETLRCTDVVFQRRGEVCMLQDNAGLVACGEVSVCEPSNDPTSPDVGVCVAPAQAGSPCGSGCDTGLMCNTGTCANRRHPACEESVL